ncbi:hypothetical protein A3Q56_06786 [Intoshia linei]|uniref:Uncharacterized protein n=1 Tax=Intoshia linei TaxID=1819745 RepID=A0A177AU29_9BILA|nr:hypothetical protein A3Q56_06786 [Intoshia linei]
MNKLNTTDKKMIAKYLLRIQRLLQKNTELKIERNLKANNIRKIGTDKFEFLSKINGVTYMVVTEKSQSKKCKNVIFMEELMIYNTEFDEPTTLSDSGIYNCENNLSQYEYYLQTDRWISTFVTFMKRYHQVNIEENYTFI